MQGMLCIFQRGISKRILNRMSPVYVADSFEIEYLSKPIKMNKS
jgi:hypothetical protein